MKRSILLAAAAAAALIGAGCGSDNPDASTPSSGGGTPSSGGGLYGPSPSPSPATSQPGATAKGVAKIGVRRGTLGTFVVDARGRTIYLLTADKRNQSNCSGECAQAWPPVTTEGKAKAGRGVTSSLLSSIKRSDGSTQVTYAGHPLYTFTMDKAAGQTSGQGFNAFGGLWWVIGTDGKLINKK